MKSLADMKKTMTSLQGIIDLQVKMVKWFSTDTFAFVTIEFLDLEYDRSKWL